MSTESDLYDALRLDGTIAGYVGPRIYPDAAPQDVAVPYVVYTRDATQMINTIHGTVLGQTSEFSVRMYGESRAEVDAIAAAAVAALPPGEFYLTDRSSAYLPDVDLYVAGIVCRNNF